jgi:UDP-3-O-acyl N-acetylglucosamine deacetylase
MRFVPAPVGTGIVFQRIDVPDQTLIPATADYRVDVPRRTVLVRGTDSIDMVEHVLAALSGLQVDNCLIQVDRGEIPAFDGSCLELVHLLESVGTVSQKAARPVLTIDREVRVGDENQWLLAIPNSHQQLEIRYSLEYAHPAIGAQQLTYIHSREAFSRDLAGARTFLLATEAEALRAMGVGLKVSHREVLVFDQHGPVGNRLRYADECVRHKTLDVIGDLMLAPFDIVGTIIAHRSGHHLNAEMARQLTVLSRLQRQSTRNVA